MDNNNKLDPELLKKIRGENSFSTTLGDLFSGLFSPSAETIEKNKLLNSGLLNEGEVYEYQKQMAAKQATPSDMNSGPMDSNPLLSSLNPGQSLSFTDPNTGKARNANNAFNSQPGMGDLKEVERASYLPGLKGGMGDLLQSQRSNDISEQPMKSSSLPQQPQKSTASPKPNDKQIIPTKEFNETKEPTADELLLQRQQELRDAQQAQNNNLLSSNIMRGAEDIASGFRRYNPNADYRLSENLQKLASIPVEQFQQKQKLNKDVLEEQKDKISLDKAKQELSNESSKKDPNSSISRLARQTLKLAMPSINVPDDLSASSIDKFTPLTSLINTYQMVQERKELAAARKDEREKAASDRSDSKKAEQAKGLASNISKSKAYQDYREVQTAYEIMKDTIDDPNPQKDTAAIYSFVKMLDPGSVVREGEIKFTQEGRSIPNSIKMGINKAMKGGILLPQERKNILEFATKRLNTAKKQYEAANSAFIKQAEKLKISDLVQPELGLKEDEKKSDNNSPFDLNAIDEELKRRGH